MYLLLLNLRPIYGFLATSYHHKIETKTFNDKIKLPSCIPHIENENGELIFSFTEKAIKTGVWVTNFDKLSFNRLKNNLGK